MIKPISAFSGFSVLDVEKSKAFYTEKLGLKVDQDEMGLQLHLPDGGTVFVYQKDNHEPATYTVLNIVVEDIDAGMEELRSNGVEFIHYNNEELPQDEKGVLRGLSANMGPDIAWFEDPSGNILGIIQDK